jgi:hypothetical protein
VPFGPFRADPGYNCGIMLGPATMLIAAMLVNPASLVVETQRGLDDLSVSFRLLEPLPAAIDAALPSGAVVRIRYPIRVRAPRRIWWDKKLWRGDAVAHASFDPVTGRYRCELVLDGVIVTGTDFEDPADVRAWLAEPGEIRFALPEGRREATLRVRVRAIYSSSTKLLIFPSVDGTDWVETVVPPIEEEPEPSPPAES